MRSYSNPRRYISHRILSILILFAFMAGCSANHGLPAEAQQVLDESVRSYYTSPWSGSTHFDVLTQVEISNAWRARGEDDGELWCVELMVFGRQVDAIQAISAIWIVTRLDELSAWQAAALETISASTTIEKCEL